LIWVLFIEAKLWDLVRTMQTMMTALFRRYWRTSHSESKSLFSKSKNLGRTNWVVDCVRSEETWDPKAILMGGYVSQGGNIMNLKRNMHPLSIKFGMSQSLENVHFRLSNIFVSLSLKNGILRGGLTFFWVSGNLARPFLNLDTIIKVKPLSTINLSEKQQINKDEVVGLW